MIVQPVSVLIAFKKHSRKAVVKYKNDFHSENQELT